MPTPFSMITIVGTGALASLFAARLAPHVPLTMFGSWQEAIEAINTRGLVVRDEQGEKVFRVRATHRVEECAGTQLALVLVKAYQTERVAKEIKKFLVPGGVALTLQNGLGNYETLAAELGEVRVAMGVALQGANMVAAGIVRDGGRGAINVAEHPRLAQWVTLFRQAGLDVREFPQRELPTVIWYKLLINVPINPLTALLRVRNGELLQRAEALRVADQAVDECLTVMAAKGITPPPRSPHDRYREVLAATAANQSSMLQDVLRGAPTEIESINGAVVRAGKSLEIPTPVNKTLVSLLMV